jgi:hypothetical protein
MIDYKNGILKIEYWDGEKWRDMSLPILQMNVISPKRFRLIRIANES